MAAFLDNTRTSYDTIADSYAEAQRDALPQRRIDRALMSMFVELVEPAGTVADIGCGPGMVAAYLNTLGLNTFGIDLSPRMVELARAAFPGIRYAVGTMTDLDIPDGSLAGIVSCYAFLYLPPDQLAGAFAGFHRALAPGGELMLICQVGDEKRHVTELIGHTVDMHSYRHPVDRFTTEVRGAGLDIHAQLVREPLLPTERGPLLYLFARKPSQTTDK